MCRGADVSAAQTCCSRVCSGLITSAVLGHRPMYRPMETVVERDVCLRHVPATVSSSGCARPGSTFRYEPFYRPVALGANRVA